MNSRPLPAVLLVATFLATVGILRTLEPGAVATPGPVGWGAEQWSAAASHGSVLSALGGMRSVVANVGWLQTNLAWERQDPVATRTSLELTVAADERPLYFWLNGARMLACDLPEWRMTSFTPAAVRQRINEEQAQQALRFLEKGVRWHGPAAPLYIEMANIHLRRRSDLENASRYYRLAAEQPDAPAYAARIHAELLRALGRPAEALAWLQRILTTLRPDDPLAEREIVVARIRALELELARR